MTKIIDLYKNINLPEKDALQKIREQDAQLDLDEKTRKHKRTEKWDDLLFNSVQVVMVLFILVLFRVIKLPQSFDYFLGAGGITTIITVIFRIVMKQNSS